MYNELDLVGVDENEWSDDIITTNSTIRPHHSGAVRRHDDRTGVAG